VQLWVNLPRANKWARPRYQDIRGKEVNLLTSEDGGALLRVIAGEICGHAGPGSTFTPITMAHVTLSPGARVQVPWRSGFNALGYVLAGRGSAGVERWPVRTSQLVVFGASAPASAAGEVPGAVDVLSFEAAGPQDGQGRNMEVLLLGGQPIGEPVVHYGPFVMNSRDEIAQALEDYQAGRLGQIPARSHVR
jgi:redox-sensitive bicupin YhaK (pirin superfamily)